MVSWKQGALGDQMLVLELTSDVTTGKFPKLSDL